MKKNRLWMLMAVMLVCAACLCACAAAPGGNGAVKETHLSADGSLEASKEGDAQASPTLEELLGEDYVSYLTETITMQMGNRMDKNPDVRYFPIVDDAPLSDYVTIDETTEFTVDEEGNPVILFPAGTVTDADNGEQSFRIPKLYS